MMSWFEKKFQESGACNSSELQNRKSRGQNAAAKTRHAKKVFIESLEPRLLLSAAPVATLDSATTAEDTQVIIDVLANDTDADGDVLAISAASSPAHGAVVINANNTLTYTPAVNFNGADAFNYTVSDGQGGFSTAAVNLSVTAVNDAPVANPDFVTTAEDTPVTFHLLANDTDVEGDALRLIAATQLSHGAISFNAVDQSLTYTPVANFNGTETFTYYMRDMPGLTATALVTITVTPANALPVATADTATTAEDTPLAINVLANDSDQDGDTLTITAASTPAHGAVAINADKTITYTPAANFYGTDAFTYTLSDGQGGFSTATANLTVTSVNDAPVANPDFVTTAEDTPVTFYVLANDTDVDGDALRLVAATALSHGTISYNGADQSLTYTPTANFHGTETFTCYNRDAAGATSGALVTITVTSVNDVPVATADTATLNEDTPLIIDVLANDSNPDGGVLTISALSSPAHGTAAVNADNTITYTPTANFNGTDAFTYTIRDAQGDSSTATVSLTVTAVNDAPTAVPDFVTTAVNTPVKFRVLDNDYDVDGDAMRLIAATALSHGTFTYDGADQSLTYTPVANYIGTDSFTYYVRDTIGANATALVTITVRPPNTAPVANANAVTTAEDTPVTFNVLANDTDANGDTLTITALSSPAHGTVSLNANQTLTYRPSANYYGADAFTYTVNDGWGGSATATVNLTVTAVNDVPVATADNRTTAEDTPVTFNVLSNDSNPDGGSLTISALSSPAHGSVVVNANNTLTYRPSANFNGADAFTYTIRDAQGDSSTATVNLTVTPVNDAPTANPDVVTTAEDTPVQFDVVANDTDVEGDAVTFLSAAAPLHGTLSYNATDKRLTYAPAADFNGTDSFIYQIRDAAGATSSATVTLTVTPVNDLAAAVLDAAATAEDTPMTINVLANDSNPDGDILTLTSVTSASHGSAVISANNIIYTPSANFNGTDAFTYTFSDGEGGFSTATVNLTVTPVNDAPTANPDVVTTAEDTPVQFNVVANDSDLEGDAVSFLAADAAPHGTLSYNAADNLLTYTPAPDFNGTDSFIYHIRDAAGATSSATVTVTVTPVNDVAAAVLDTVTTAEDTPVTLNVLANDLNGDGDTLTITSVTSAAHGAVAISANNIIYTPVANFNGTDAFTYTFSDGLGGFSTATVNLTVTPVNDAPTAVPDFVTTVVNTPVKFRVLDNDYDVDGDALRLFAATALSHGTFVYDGADQSLTYTPVANYVGPDSFTYYMRDASGVNATALVTITVRPPNTAPVVGADAVTTAEDTPVTFNVLANDTDANGDILTITAISSPAHGTVSLNANQTLTYRPSANYYGADAFTYTVNDGWGGSATATVNLTVTAVNDLAVAVLDTATTAEDTQVAINVLANDRSGDGAAMTITGVTSPSHGTVAISANNIIYTPSADFNGTDAFTYTIIDGWGGSATATVNLTVTPVNDAPVAQDAAFLLDEDAPFSGSVVLTDIDSASLAAQMVSGPTRGMLVLNPGGSFTYTPDAEFNGTDSFTYRVNDGSLTSNVATVNLTIAPVNDAPVLSAIADRIVTEGATLTLTATSTDLEQASQTFTYSLDSAPAGAAIDPTTGLFTWTPTESQGYGKYDITVRVTDDGAPALSDTKTFTVTVMEDTVIDAGPLANDGVADIFRMIRSGDDAQVFLNGTLIFDQALSGIPDLSFIGSADDDTLIVDTTGGNPTPSGGILFNGNDGIDNVTLEGAVSTVTHTFTGATSGAIGFDGVTQVTYSNTEALADNLISSDKFLVYGSAADNVTMTIGENQTSLASSSNPSLTLANPETEGWLTLMTKDGNDVINLINSRTTAPGFSVVLDAGTGGNRIYDGSSYALTRITGTENADVIRLNQTPLSTTVVVNTSTNTLYGASRVELIGLGGNDQIRLYGNVANVLADGGAGNDTIDGTAFRGKLTAIGGEGDDILRGTPGNDVLIGGAGSDNIAAGAGNDLIAHVNDGTDVVDVGTGTDDIVIVSADTAQLKQDLLGNVVIQQNFWLKEFVRGQRVDPNDLIRITLG